MPEEEIETQELKERLEEAHEHAHGHGHAGEGAQWITWLSLSTAVIAVVAAIAALESGSYANEAIVQKNDAILHQSKADDAWGYYQAKGIEAALYATQAETVPNPTLANQWRASAQHETEERNERRRAAETEEHTAEASDGASEHSLHVHHQFAKSVTIFQVAIAMSAIAALTRKPWVWWVSMAFGAAGLAFFVVGFVAA